MGRDVREASGGSRPAEAPRASHTRPRHGLRLWAPLSALPPGPYLGGRRGRGHILPSPVRRPPSSPALVFQSDDNQVLWELIGGPPKTRNVSACWQDGRFFAENETWVVDSCTQCTCKVRPPGLRSGGRGNAPPPTAPRRCQPTEAAWSQGALGWPWAVGMRGSPEPEPCRARCRSGCRQPRCFAQTETQIRGGGR